jgi:hypothetical protein
MDSIARVSLTLAETSPMERLPPYRRGAPNVLVVVLDDVHDLDESRPGERKHGLT